MKRNHVLRLLSLVLFAALLIALLPTAGAEIKGNHAVSLHKIGTGMLDYKLVSFTTPTGSWVQHLGGDHILPTGGVVTYWIEPFEGNLLLSVRIIDKDAEDVPFTTDGNGNYKFTMPDKQVYLVVHAEPAGYVMPKPEFTDIETDNFYFVAACWALENGITTGTSPTTFSPKTVCTRGQVMTFLWRLAGKPEPKSTKNPFTDVSKDDYCFKAILWAIEQGITNGTTATTFSPNEECTGAHIAAFMCRAIKMDYQMPGQPWYQRAWNFLGGYGIVDGPGYGVDKGCTRANVVDSLFRLNRTFPLPKS